MSPFANDAITAGLSGGQKVAQACNIPAREKLRGRIDPFFEYLHGGENFRAIFLQDTAPHFWRTARDAGGIAKPLARQTKRRRFASGNGIHEAASQQVRQMADHRDLPVVDFRREANHPALQALPKALETFDEIRRRVFSRREDARGIDEEIGPGRLASRAFRTRHGMAPKEAIRAKKRFHRSDDRAFDTSDISDDRSRGKQWQNRPRDRSHCSNGNAENNQVRAGDCFFQFHRANGRNSAPFRPGDGVRASPPQTNVGGFLQRHRQGCPEQARPQNRYLAKRRGRVGHIQQLHGVAARAESDSLLP